MYACQIFRAAEKELPGLADDIAAGRFERLKGWLNDKIHKCVREHVMWGWVGAGRAGGWGSVAPEIKSPGVAEPC